MICHFCKIARLQFYLFLESSDLTILFLSCNRFINFTFINTRAACLPKWLTVKLQMLPRSLNKEFGSTSALKTSLIKMESELKINLKLVAKNVGPKFPTELAKQPICSLIGRENTPTFTKKVMPTEQNHPR